MPRTDGGETSRKRGFSYRPRPSSLDNRVLNNFVTDNFVVFFHVFVVFAWFFRLASFESCSQVAVYREGPAVLVQQNILRSLSIIYNFIVCTVHPMPSQDDKA